LVVFTALSDVVALLGIFSAVRTICMMMQTAAVVRTLVWVVTGSGWIGRGCWGSLALACLALAFVVSVALGYAPIIAFASGHTATERVALVRDGNGNSTVLRALVASGWWVFYGSSWFPF
jgi:hypothetical protein